MDLLPSLVRPATVEDEATIRSLIYKRRGPVSEGVARYDYESGGESQ